VLLIGKSRGGPVHPGTREGVLRKEEAGVARQGARRRIGRLRRNGGTGHGAGRELVVQNGRHRLARRPGEPSPVEARHVGRKEINKEEEEASFLLLQHERKKATLDFRWGAEMKISIF